MKTNRPPSSARTSSAAFTLVELLAVIAIIGILSAITIPLVGKIRSVAHRSVCQSGLRQIGAAVLLYAQENRGVLPGQKSPHGAGLAASQTCYARADNQLATCISPYLNIPVDPGANTLVPLFLCPTFARKHPDLVVPAPQKFLWQLNISNQIDGVADSWPFGNFNKNIPSLRLDQIRDWSRTTMMQDADLKMVTASWAAAPEPVHGNVRNCVWFDGHVSAIAVK
jgi:prepilin-type N-terminal cleavage/methylation domain-containing protein/prepilin-type processing-associated H-X9-DG protein